MGALVVPSCDATVYAQKGSGDKDVNWPWVPGPNTACFSRLLTAGALVTCHEASGVQGGGRVWGPSWLRRLGKICYAL